MSKYDGGPAFPSQWQKTADGYQRADAGMSLRDYFAGQVLASMQVEEPTAASVIAKMCYTIADAMLAVRKM